MIEERKVLATVLLSQWDLNEAILDWIQRKNPSNTMVGLDSAWFNNEKGDLVYPVAARMRVQIK